MNERIQKCFSLIAIDELMAQSADTAEVPIGVIDGPVDLAHADLKDADIRPVGATQVEGCVEDRSLGCAHGTFVAGQLAASRHSDTPGNCPDSPLISRPIFCEALDFSYQGETFECGTGKLKGSFTPWRTPCQYFEKE